MEKITFKYTVFSYFLIEREHYQYNLSLATAEILTLAITLANSCSPRKSYTTIVPSSKIHTRSSEVVHPIPTIQPPSHYDLEQRSNADKYMIYIVCTHIARSAACSAHNTYMYYDTILLRYMKRNSMLHYYNWGGGRGEIIKYIAYYYDIEVYEEK